MAGHVPASHITKSSCNRQEKEKNPTSYGCISRIRANRKQDFSVKAWVRAFGKYRLGSQREKRVTIIILLPFALRKVVAESIVAKAKPA